MMEDYVQLLRESLEKKVSLLERISVRNEQQRQLFGDDKTSPDDLEANIQAKGMMIDQILALDDGFEQLFGRVEQELSEHREDYKDEIRAMQDLIRKITDLTARVESQEQRNRNLASSFFAGKKSSAKQIRKGAAAATRYYQGMMRDNVIKPQILDTKE